MSIHETPQRIERKVNTNTGTVLAFRVLSAVASLTSLGADAVNFLTSSRVAEAAGCKERVSAIDVCPPEGQTPRAGIFLKAISYDNVNGRPGFQAGQDSDAEWMIGWRYRVVNTADPRQFIEAIVDADGDLIDQRSGSNLFIFDGQPNTTEPIHGKPAINIEIRRRDAFDRTLNEVVPLGDPVILPSAVNCTPLEATLRTNKEYLTQPTKPTPTKSEFVPPTPAATPTPRVPVVKVPVQLPRTGDWSAQRPLEELSEAERRLIEEYPAVPRQ